MEKKKITERSKCCGAKVRVVMSKDFFGDNPNTQTIGTCHYVCLKCGEPCDIYFKERRTWIRNPKTQIQKDKRQIILKKEINKEIEEIGNA